MNAMAMHQTLFGNVMILGQGFTQGKNEELTETVNGWKVSVNGLNPMPELSSEYLLNRLIGSVEHDSLMIGMFSAGGVIDYHIVETEAAYALVVGVKLDPSLMGESEMHYEYAAVMMKKDFNPPPRTLRRTRGVV